MNIVHFTHGKVNPFGESGMSRTVYYLCKYQKLLGHRSEVFSVVDGISKHETYKRDEFVTIQMFPRLFPRVYKKKHIKNFILENKDRIDLVHFHLMWLPDKNIAAKMFSKLGIPYCVTCHGAYAPWKMKIEWKKKKKLYKKLPAKYLYELPFLNSAAAIHALYNEQITELREFGVKKPIFVVPNGAELSDIPEHLNNAYFRQNEFIENAEMKIYWIGILQPIKNLDGLIIAASMLPGQIKNKVAFIIIGPDKERYSRHVKEMVTKRGVADLFHFLGPLYGKDKYSAIASSDIFIQPSWSESLSVAMLEAVACAKPCILSRTCHVSYLYKHNFFEMVEPWPEDIARGIVEMLKNRDKWGEMGARGRTLVESKLNWESIAFNMVHNYGEAIKRYKWKNE